MVGYWDVGGAEGESVRARRGIWGCFFMGVTVGLARLNANGRGGLPTVCILGWIDVGSARPRCRWTVLFFLSRDHDGLGPGTKP
jgi:hypothetical protein